MRIAVISDIHANLYALKTVLEHIDHNSVDCIFCLGDSVGYSPYPNEVIDLLRYRGVCSIKGNYDHAIGYHEDNCGCGYTDACMLDLAAKSVRFTNDIISEANRQYLAGLPDQIRLTIGPFKLLMVHGSPRRINETVQQGDPVMASILDDISDNVLIYGHTHKPYYEQVRGKHVINAGSVGKPSIGENRATYVCITITEHTLQPEIFYVTYPLEEAMKAIKDEPTLPNDFAEALAF